MKVSICVAMNLNDKNVIQRKVVNQKKDDNSTKSSIDRIEQEKREFREREQELRKQRNSTLNGDSGNVSQEEQEDEIKEGYFEKIERLKRSEHERTNAPLLRGPKKQTNLAFQWEQKVANGRKDDNDDN
ncbi:unnamed protein product [Didymodactylos carnosus]|uniref:Uncharacterized protein n=1 Tax=Didymodactylos carnosus TaxID=1234261 RepID=A0A8S2ZFV1_9BILA|nr:unnamed protein product [Didymodactylos carnosus]